MIESPCWSPFRELMEMADEFGLEDKIETLVDSKGIIFFFKKDNDVFGTGEDGRIAFAKLKNPDKDMPKGWEEDAGFSATNLTKEIQGESSLFVVRNENIKDIKVIDKEDAIKELKKTAKNSGSKNLGKKIKTKVITFDQLVNMMKPKDSDEAPNFIQARED